MDVTEANFETAVIERSRTLPVVVDFWAEWCGPCRQLGPVIEKAVADRGGKVELAKVDTDANPGLAQAFQIQGIPAVKAFKDGKVVAEFVGAQGAPAVERFLDGLLPSEAELLTEQGDEASLRRAVELEPTRAAAAVPLARILLKRGETVEAAQLLEAVPGSFTAAGMLARLRLLELDPLPASVGAGFAALDAGEVERGLELLITGMAETDGAADDVRQVIVGVLDELGPESDLARSARRKLAAALY